MVFRSFEQLEFLLFFCENDDENDTVIVWCCYGNQVTGLWSTTINDQSDKLKLGHGVLCLCPNELISTLQDSMCHWLIFIEYKAIQS